MNLTVNILETTDYVNTTPLEILAGDISIGDNSSTVDGTSFTATALGETTITISKSGYIPYTMTINDVGLYDQTISIVLLADLDIDHVNYHKPFPTFFTFRDWGSYQVDFYYATSFKGQSSFIKYNADETKDTYNGTKASIVFDGPGEYAVKSRSINDDFDIYYPLEAQTDTNVTVEEYKASLTLAATSTNVRPNDSCFPLDSEASINFDITLNHTPADSSLYSVELVVINPKGEKLYDLSFLQSNPPVDPILFDINTIGSYTVTLTLNDYENNIQYEEEIILEGCDYFVIDYSSCGSYTLRNYGTNDIQVSSEAGDISTTIPAKDSIGYTPSSERVVQLSTNLVGDEENKKYYLINNHCGIEMCMAAYIEDLLCAPRDRCTPCPPESQLKQMYLFYNTYFMKVHQLFYQNSFFEALSDDVINDITKIENLAAKLKEYCADSSIDSCCK